MTQGGKVSKEESDVLLDQLMSSTGKAKSGGPSTSNPVSVLDGLFHLVYQKMLPLAVDPVTFTSANSLFFTFKKSHLKHRCFFIPVELFFSLLKIFL